MDRFGPTGKVSKKLVHLLRWSSLPGRTGRKFWLNGSRPKIYSCGLALSSEPRIWKFHVIIWQTTSQNCIKERAARVAPLFFPHSTNQIIISLMGSFRKNDGKSNDNTTNQWFDWLNEKKKSCCTCCTPFGLICCRSLPMTSWNFHIWCSDDNASP